ncbi:MAG: VOC family protein [Ferruginibacter sp.]
MTKEIWINLPVKDVSKSKDFFTQLGFTFNTRYGNDKDSASLLIGSKNVVVMLFPEHVFESFTGTKIADLRQGAEVLISIDAESREEVDELANKAVAAGGILFGKPNEIQGWMYGCGFSDLDGHRWNVLYMDMNRMPKQG